MFDILFPIYAFSGSFFEHEYINLSQEEKDNLDYMDSCLFSENEKINNASFYIMLLLIEISNDINKYEPEEIGMKINDISKDLSLEERDVINKFIPACINSIGIYSEESKKERKLKKERNDK